MKSVIKITVNEHPSNVNFFKATVHWGIVFGIFFSLSYLAKLADKEIKSNNAYAKEFRGSRSPAIVPNK